MNGRVDARVRTIGRSSSRRLTEATRRNRQIAANSMRIEVMDSTMTPNVSECSAAPITSAAVFRASSATVKRRLSRSRRPDQREAAHRVGDGPEDQRRGHDLGVQARELPFGPEGRDDQRLARDHDDGIGRNREHQQRRCRVVGQVVERFRIDLAMGRFPEEHLADRGHDQRGGRASTRKARKYWPDDARSNRPGMSRNGACREPVLMRDAPVITRANPHLSRALLASAPTRHLRHPDAGEAGTEELSRPVTRLATSPRIRPIGPTRRTPSSSWPPACVTPCTTRIRASSENVRL